MAEHLDERTIASVTAVMPEMTEEDFTTLDASGDGPLDADEITVATEAGLLPA